MNQRHNYDHDDNASHASFKIAVIGFLSLVAIVIGIKAASAQTIYLPTVQRNKPQPTVMPCDPCAHSTPYPPTATPFMIAPPMLPTPTEVTQ